MGQTLHVFLVGDGEIVRTSFWGGRIMKTTENFAKDKIVGRNVDGEEAKEQRP